MNSLFFLVTALLTAAPAIAETRKYGPLMLDFGRAQQMGQSIVVPGTNPQKQPLFIAVLCEERLFNSLALNQNGMNGINLPIFTSSK